MEKHYFLVNGYDLGQVKIRNYNGRSAGRKVRLALAKYLHDFRYSTNVYPFLLSKGIC